MDERDTTNLEKALSVSQLFYEDCDLGSEFVTPGRTILESDIALFAGLSGDYNRLHTDAEFSSKTAFGKPVALGLLVLSSTSGLTARLPLLRGLEGSILGLANLECRWRAPTFAGDTLKVRDTVADRTETSKPARGIVRLDRTAVNQRGEDVMLSEWKLLVKRRST